MSNDHKDSVQTSKDHHGSYSALPYLHSSNQVTKDEQPSPKLEETIYGTNDVQTSSTSEKQSPVQETNEESQKYMPNIGKVPWQIYLSRVLSAWGDRIWDFALGIFMNLINPESLRLAAIQGFLINISVILFGSTVGNWIDKNKRLFAAQVFLIVQNVAVAIACIVLTMHFFILTDKVRIEFNYLYVLEFRYI